MRNKFKVLGLATAVAVALGAPLSGNATITINPDGLPGGNIVVGALDWSPTSFLGKGAVTAIQNFQVNAATGSALPTTFDVVVAAKLGNFQDPSGNAITGTGLNTAYEWTMVSRFTENVIDVHAAAGKTKIQADFQLVTAAGGFLEIYQSPIRNASQINGSGFNDGTLILRATSVDAAQGSFAVNCSSFPALPSLCGPTTLTGPVNLDQFPNPAGNNYGTQKTLVGSGSNDNITLGGITFDSDFFASTPTSISLAFANISQGLPFISVDPMACYVDDPNLLLNPGPPAAVAAPPLQCAGYLQTNGQPYSGQLAGTNGGYVPTTGAVNGIGFGSPAGFTGDDVFQTDYNSPIDGAVPEPGSLALLGAVLGAAGLVGRRRRSTV